MRSRPLGERRTRAVRTHEQPPAPPRPQDNSDAECVLTCLSRRPLGAMQLDALPRDLLHLIVSFIPYHPRLVILGVLSRRWRSIVLSSLPAFPLYPQAGLSVSHYPLIAHLAPPDVRTLHHSEFKSNDCRCSQLTQLGALTSLSLRLSNALGYECERSLLQRNLSSLTSLSISMLHTPPHLSVDSVCALHFPRLTDLAIRDDRNQLLAPFVAAHASQLTSLTIEGASLLTLPPLPHCRHLVLRYTHARAHIFIHTHTHLHSHSHAHNTNRPAHVRTCTHTHTHTPYACLGTFRSPPSPPSLLPPQTLSNASISSHYTAAAVGAPRCTCSPPQRCAL